MAVKKRGSQRVSRQDRQQIFQDISRCLKTIIDKTISDQKILDQTILDNKILFKTALDETILEETILDEIIQDSTRIFKNKCFSRLRQNIFEISRSYAQTCAYQA